MNTITAESLKALSIASLAAVIRKDWQKVNFAAKPYLQAMQSLDSISDNYGAENAREIVAYFLSNASSWRGDVAKLVKAELKNRLKK